MNRARSLFENLEQTLDELGLKMGYPPDAARKSAWQFTRKTDDPRIGTLRRFAEAMGIPLRKLID